MLLLVGSVGHLCAQVVPNFQLEPVPQRVVAGHALSLRAIADPSEAEIQWYRDGI